MHRAVSTRVDHAMPEAHITSRILHAADYRRMQWKNGAGWTSEILRVPDCDDWDWRLSIADVDADAPFSAFAGVDRWLMLLAGNGMRLRFDDGHIQTLVPPHGAAQFSGERALTGELLEGASRDFNVMWKRDRLAVQTWKRPLVGPMVSRPRRRARQRSQGTRGRRARESHRTQRCRAPPQGVALVAR